jgi:amino acid transporter
MDDKTITNKRYRKSLGILELVAFGLGGTIGSGIFIVPSISASIAGPSSIIAWIIASASASAVMFCLAKTSSRYPSTGAFYSIFSKIFSRKISLLLVLMYLIACIFAISAIVSGVGQYVLSILANNSNINSDLNNNFIHYNNNQILIVFFIEIITIVVFCFINIKDGFISGKAENILTITKVAPLIILIVILVPQIKESNFSPFFHSYSDTTSAKFISTSNLDFLKALVGIYFAFAGFEICAIPAEETK